MIIPKHRVCDICKEDIEWNDSFITLKENALDVMTSFGAIKAIRKIDICHDCWLLVKQTVRKELDKEVK